MLTITAGQLPASTKAPRNAEQADSTQTTITVTITRGWGGRRVSVPLHSLRGWHVATRAGGRRRRLPHPALGAYLVDCRDAPGLDHDCTHGPAPHTVKVIVPRQANDRALYDVLWERARGLVHNRR